MVYLKFKTNKLFILRLMKLKKILYIKKKMKFLLTKKKVSTSNLNKKKEFAKLSILCLLALKNKLINNLFFKNELIIIRKSKL